MQPRRRRCVRPSAERESKHFLKAILPSPIHSNQMRIPEDFITRYGAELLSVATIEVPCGCVWEMGLNKCDKHILFCNNWEEFVKFYSISYGCHLVFKYEGNSKFNVLIFDATSVEIYYPCKNTHPKCPKIRARVDHQHYSHQIRMSNSASKRAKDAAAASNKEPKKPYFISTIKRQRVYVPVEFAQKYLKPKVPMKLQTSSREQWDVSCLKHCVRAMIIQKGIPAFARENKLSEGDSYVFELIKRKPVVLKVTPFGVVEWGNSRRR